MLIGCLLPPVYLISYFCKAGAKGCQGTCGCSKGITVAKKVLLDQVWVVVHELDSTDSVSETTN